MASFGEPCSRSRIALIAFRPKRAASSASDGLAAIAAASATAPHPSIVAPASAGDTFDASFEDLSPPPATKESSLRNARVSAALCAAGNATNAAFDPGACATRPLRPRPFGSAKDAHIVATVHVGSSVGSWFASGSKETHK